jgi:cellulose synthase operon protein C
LKWFRNSFRSRILLAAYCAAIATVVVTVTLALRVPRLHGLRAALSAYSTLPDWLTNTESGSGVEAALYRLMNLPTGDVLYRRPPRESRTQLADLIKANDEHGALYSLRALQDEQALDFVAAETDWKTWTDHAPDRAAAELDLADFYHRRLRPQDEIAALTIVAQLPAPPSEKFVASTGQRSWKAFDRILTVVQENALGSEVADQTWREWIARYPSEPSVYSRFFDDLLSQKRFDDASALIAQYSRAFPSDTVFPMKAQASLAYRRGSIAEGLAIYDKFFEPLWPPELIQSYFSLLKETRSLPAFFDRMRASLSRNPDDLNAAARLFYAYQQQGRLDAAKQVIADYCQSKESRNAAWSAQELYTFARMLEAVQAYPEAARYYFALNNSQGMPDAQQRAVAGLIGILLDAPEQPFRLGAGNLSMYRDIATMDQGPGYLNGILSLFFNTTYPRSEYSTEDQLATPYFHRAKAAELLAQFDTRFPNATERAALHARLIHAYGVYGENDAVIRAAKDFLVQFPKDPQRVEIALTLADAYARTNRTREEFALYDQLLRELAAQAEGVPLGDGSARYSKPVPGQESVSASPANARLDNASAENPRDDAAASQDGNAVVVRANPAPPQAFSTQANAATTLAVRSPQYEQVLNRYLGRLVAMKQLPQALTVLRGELDHDPDDPGIYERLSDFLSQNQLGGHDEEVYRRAIQQFDDKTWYAKLARYYIRERRSADYAALTSQVTKIFSGTELESYLDAAPAPDLHLAVQVNLYAHQRFPHDLAFTRNLLAFYQGGRTENAAAWQKLIAEHWFENAGLRNEFFEYLSRTGKLDFTLAALREQNNEIPKGDWNALASRNPAAARFLVESDLWQSHFEECAPAADALAAEYPADLEIGRDASSLYRSLAYFDPADTTRAVAVEKHLLDYDPGSFDIMARIGDIYADRSRFADAAPYWFRMAEARPGVADGYLQSATIFWDYFDFDNAIAQLEKGRQKLGNPALYSYEMGAIYENQRDYSKAIAEYVRGAVANGGESESRSRLLALARRPSLAHAVDEATAALLSGSDPSPVAIALRVDVLKTQRRNADLSTALNALLDRSSSLDVIEYVAQVAREQSLVQVQQHSLERQIALATDPTRRIELRYDLVSFYESNRMADAAQNEVDALYRENPKLLGVVRATVDYDWSHKRGQQAVTVLEEAAHSAYPALAQQFNFEAARKLTDLGQYAPARALLNDLLDVSPYDGSYLTAVADTYARAGDDAGLRDFYQAKIALLKNAPLDRVEKTAQIAALRRGLIPALTRLKVPADAVDQYIELINAYPDDDGLDSEAAIYAARHQQQSRLLDFYRKTVSDSPRDSRWSVVLARLETTLEDYPAAIDAYSKAITIRPDRVDLYTARSTLNEKLQHYDDAIADYEKLYTLSYKDPSWLEKVAETRARQGRPDLAVAALGTALIEGRQAKAADYFEAARQLESWNMLDEARSFAEKGADLAGPDLLASLPNQSGAALYARILTRVRKPDVAYARLSAALASAGELPGITDAIKRVEEKGIASVTNDEWREQERQARINIARGSFAAALKEMATAAHTYHTPEETQTFVQLLQTKASAALTDDLSALFLPAAETGLFTALEADWKWRLAASRENGLWMQWVDLQRSRLLFNDAGKQLESFAPHVRLGVRNQVYISAANLYRDTGDEASELRCLENIGALNEGDEALRQRYYSLLLAQNPQKFVDLSSSGPQEARDSATQYAVLNAQPPLALQAVKARGAGLPPVWTLGYTGITGLYLNQLDASTGDAFHAALGDDPIGDRIGKPVDRNRQLAGELWFYYGSRYGEYLSLSGSSNAEDYLPATQEFQPESASPYEQLGGWYGDRGQTQQALDQYHLALQLRPGDAMIYDRMALLLWKQGKKSDALDAWKTAIALVVKQIDQRKVPPRFWPDFAAIVGHLGSRGQFALVRPQVDAMLRAYIRRNGSYMTEPLLQAVYKADGDTANATAWMLELAAVGNPPDAVLDSIVDARWIPDAQRPRIYARQVEIARANVASSEGEARNQAANRLRSLQIQWIESLITISDYAQAKQILESIPAEEKKLNQAQWLPLEIKLAAHDATLAAMVEHWRQDSSSAPPPDLLRNAATALDKSSGNIVLGYVYQSAIDSHDLSATNFLGLAEIRIDDGDISGAVALLQRMVLVSGDQYTDLDSAAALLVRKGRGTEAISFLTQLSVGVPWQPAYRLRLDAARLKATQDTAAALDDLTALAKNPSATYEVRTQAALALSGKRAVSSLGSTELDLLARGTVSVKEAQRPYFIAARIAAAKSAPLAQRISLLRQAIEILPANDDARLPLFRAALDAKEAHLAINAAELFVGRNGYPSQFYGGQEGNAEASEEVDEEPEADADAGDQAAYPNYDSGPGRFYSLPRAERAALYAGIAASYRQIGEPVLALSSFRRALAAEPDPGRRKAIVMNIAELRHDMARHAANVQRAPQIHQTLDQNHPVRPRLQASAERKQP